MFFKIQTEKRKGNLHLRISGKASHHLLNSLVSTMEKHHRGEGNIFIHTEQITEVEEHCPQVFRELMAQSQLPHQKTYMIGEKGFELGGGQTKVIIKPAKKSRCSGCKKRALPPPAHNLQKDIRQPGPVGHTSALAS